MPQLQLTELEIKVAWLIVDQHLPEWKDAALIQAEVSLFNKLYAAYRGMPPRAA